MKMESASNLESKKEFSFIFETKLKAFQAILSFYESLPEKVVEEFERFFRNYLQNISETRLKGKKITMLFDPEKQRLTLYFYNEDANTKYSFCRMSTRIGMTTQITVSGVEHVLEGKS